MKKPIVITEQDHALLSSLIADPRRGWKREEVQPLEEELSRAEIVSAGEIPPDVVTMNSRAELEDLDTKESMEFTVVLPEEAALSEGKISILAPVGTGMLGHRAGDVFDWPAPSGTLRLKVLSVRHPPEAARHFAAA